VHGRGVLAAWLLLTTALWPGGVWPDEDAACEPASLGWWGRRTLTRHLAREYPWITEAWNEAGSSTCRTPADRLEVFLEFEAHLRGPRWEKYRTLSCVQLGFASWTCEDPSELLLVRLAQNDPGSLVFDDVPSDAALAALAAVLQASRAGEIEDPFSESPSVVRLQPDDLLSVSLEEFCAGWLVTARSTEEGELLQLCAEPPDCAAAGACPLRVRFLGKVG